MKAIPQLRGEVYRWERGGLSGENLKRHLRALRDGVDVLEMVPVALPSVNLSLMIRISRFRRGDYPVPIMPETEGLRRKGSFPGS
jgi:hypothetical protein